MKKTLFKAMLSLLCALTLLLGVVPVTVFQVAAVGHDFPWTKENTLLEEILQRDGLLDGIWYPWISAGSSGHNLTGNDVMAKYYDTKGGETWATVELDRYGADYVYREIYNLKAMGYNMMAWGGSIYGEGVIFDDYGDVLGIKQEYLDNARRLLNICRDIGMPVMWNIYFHSSACPDFYGIDGWNIICRMLGDRTVADHYAQRFVKPLCQMLAEYPDVVALVSIADEPENEMNDSAIGNHFTGNPAAYGVNRDDMIYFLKGINDAVMEVLPGMPRTVASNYDDKSLYRDFALDLMGSNRYATDASFGSTEIQLTYADMILTEYNVEGHATDLTDDQYTQRLITFREGFQEKGYAGGFQWCWIPYATDAAYYLLNKSPASQTDFKSTVTDLRHYIDDYRAEYQGKTITLDKPVLYANDGTGLVEWIPSRQATKMTLERSDDGGKTWKALLTDVDPAKYVNAKKKGVYKDTTAPKSGFCYRITVKDAKGNTATSAPNDAAGTDQKYYKNYRFDGVDYATGTHYEKAILSKSESAKARLTSFGVAQNRPNAKEANLFLNADFESTGGQWNTSAFLKNAKVVSDSTAVSGSKSLCFDTTSVKDGTWYKFTVNVEKNTDYTLSTWIKGAYLGKNNAGHASFGVYDEALGGFMVYWDYYRDYARASRLTQQIYPTAWDEEWHLRSVSFNSGNQTQVTIALYGYGSKMWLDDIALFKSSDGVQYDATPSAFLSYRYTVECDTCEPSKSVLQNVRMDDGKSTFWQTGDGWRNGFLSFADNKYEYGKSLKYTATKNPIGNYYTKWVKVEPHTEYVFSLDFKILKSGKGKLSLLEDTMAGPTETMPLEFDGDIFGNDWIRYSIRFNTNDLTGVGIAICDLGGSALLDNIRLFKVADAKAVEDPYKDETGSTVTPPTATVKPTAKPTSIPGTTLPTSTPDSTIPTDVVADPTEPQPADPTDPAPSQGEEADPTAPIEEDEDASVDSSTEKKPNPVILWVSIAAALLILIAGGVTVFLLLKKKKQR